jgi:hypothetical protein
MDNLGYFQLQAYPGVFSLSIPPPYDTVIELTSNNAANVNSNESSKNPSNSNANVNSKSKTVVISAFNSHHVHLMVKRIKGQERIQLDSLNVNIFNPSSSSAGNANANTAANTAADVAANADAQPGAGSYISSVLGSWLSGSTNEGQGEIPNSDTFGKQVDDNTEHYSDAESADVVHVFSLASGHLYERFLKIMMLSVVKNTSKKVKFWFLKNFFSPQFKQSVQLLARQFHFKVGFVTYKWPIWLRNQEEKQRIIWGYKILFLDVLFPLNVPRVIYIDADQVVRGDINELWTMDLQGAPYGYTPFCHREDNTNKDTTGFRFWSGGFWKDHLRGKPYHISALYVVDLLRFRKIRAGDTLRGIYEQLSADPNSLANLDQDLPNFAQHMVKIHSLPQEWLWCETWCSLDSLRTAKTIDLCNNPLTKAPKLEVAKRLLPEWATLDATATAASSITSASASVGIVNGSDNNQEKDSKNNNNNANNQESSKRTELNRDASKMEL